MNIREINEEDLIEIFSWFESRKWPLPPIKNSGPKTGVVAVQDGKLFGCLWFYMNGSSIVDVDWIATNPGVSTHEAMDSVSFLIEHIKQMSKLSDPTAKIRGLRLFTKNEKLASLFEARGFKKTPSYFRLLWTLKD